LANGIVAAQRDLVLDGPLILHVGGEPSINCCAFHPKHLVNTAVNPIAIITTAVISTTTLWRMS
jgi:hypothetical protein